MKTIKTRTHVGPDGMVELKFACGVTETDVDVTVTVEEVNAHDAKRSQFDRDEWRRFVQETSGSIDDPTFVRGEQGEYEKREELL